MEITETNVYPKEVGIDCWGNKIYEDEDGNQYASIMGYDEDGIFTEVDRAY